jgi:hypothetical protein
MTLALGAALLAASLEPPSIAIFATGLLGMVIVILGRSSLEETR